MPAEASWTIISYEDLRGVVMVGDGPMGITLEQTIALEQSRDGTVAEVATTIGGNRLVRPIVESLAQEVLERLSALAGDGVQRTR